MDPDAGLLALGAAGASASLLFESGTALNCLLAISRIGVDYTVTEMTGADGSRFLKTGAPVFPDVTVQLANTSGCTNELLDLQSWFAAAAKGAPQPRTALLVLADRLGAPNLEVNLVHLVPVAFSLAQATIRLRPERIELQTFVPMRCDGGKVGCIGYPAPDPAPWHVDVSNVVGYTGAVGSSDCGSVDAGGGEQVLVYSGGAPVGTSVAPVYLRLHDTCNAARNWVQGQMDGTTANQDVAISAIGNAGAALWSLLYDGSAIARATFLGPSFLKSDGTLGLALDLTIRPLGVTSQ